MGVWLDPAPGLEVHTSLPYLGLQVAREDCAGLEAPATWRPEGGGGGGLGGGDIGQCSGGKEHGTAPVQASLVDATPVSVPGMCITSAACSLAPSK